MSPDARKRQFALDVPDTATAVAIGENVVAGPSHGALGGFLSGQQGLTLALTARHILEASPQGTLKDDSGNIVAMNAEPQADFRGPLPFFRAIGLALVQPFVTIGKNIFPRSALPFDAHLLGANVGIARKDGVEKLGTIVCYGGGARLTFGGDQAPQYFFDTLEVESDSSQAASTRPGDGGALCVSDDGSAVGIAIGVFGSRILVAPLAPLISERSYRFPTRQELEDRNLYARFDLVSRQQERSSNDLNRALQSLRQIDVEAQDFKQHFHARLPPLPGSGAF